jgi:hypothetical protein
MALCAYCHLFWWHKNPLDAAAFAREWLGRDAYESLSMRARITPKPDYAALLIALQQDLAKLERHPFDTPPKAKRTRKKGGPTT